VSFQLLLKAGEACGPPVYMKVSQKQHPFHTETTSFHVSLSLVNLVQPCWSVNTCSRKNTSPQ